VLTVFGVVVLSFMMLMYPLERRGSRFVLAFACGCAVASVYGFLAGTWPFGVVELAWAGIATRRYLELRRNVTHRVAGVRKSHSPGRVSESLA
jgi:hypothetical protein